MAGVQKRWFGIQSHTLLLSLRADVVFALAHDTVVADVARLPLHFDSRRLIYAVPHEAVGETGK